MLIVWLAVLGCLFVNLFCFGCDVDCLIVLFACKVFDMFGLTCYYVFVGLVICCLLCFVGWLAFYMVFGFVFCFGYSMHFVSIAVLWVGSLFVWILLFVNFIVGCA